MINVAELLKDCPKGMELDCTMYEGAELDCVTNDEGYPIKIIIKDDIAGNISISLTKEGCYNMLHNPKCVIFPKGKNTWEGFVPPCRFKDGDILATDLGCVFYLNTRLNTDKCYGCYAGIGSGGRFHLCEPFAYKECCGLATEEEKQKLFQAIKEHGYKWNAETKTLEKLIKPVFKIGDKISLKCEDLYWDIKTIEGDWYICTNGAKIHIEEQHHYELVLVEPKFKAGDKVKNKDNFIVTIVRIDGDYYDYVNEDGQCGVIYIRSQNEWELVPDKFDITTLKPFESRVLVRDSEAEKWKLAIWGYYDSDNIYNYPYEVVGGLSYRICIPYEGNEHLRGTTDDCNEYYKNWET